MKRLHARSPRSHSTFARHAFAVFALLGAADAARAQAPCPPGTVPLCPTTAPNWPGPANYPFVAAAPGDEAASLGDVDADGITDLLVSDHDLANWVAVFGGRAHYVFDSITYPTNVIGDLPLIWAAAAESSDSVDFGWEVQPAGDLNGDGIAEILVGDPGLRTPTVHAGRAILYTSVPGSPVSWQRAIVFTGPNLGTSSAPVSSAFGWCVASAGDMNGDGVDDVVIGAPRANGSGSGDAYLFDGVRLADLLSGSPLPATLAHTDGVPLASRVTPSSSVPSTAGGSFGTVVMGVGDIDGDGRDDMIVGAPSATNTAGDDDAGAAYVFTWPAGEANPELLLADQGTCPDDFFGYEASAVGDVLPESGGTPRNEYAVGAIQQDLIASPNGYSGGYLQVRTFAAPKASALVYEERNPAAPSPASACLPPAHSYSHVRFGAYLAGDPDNDGDSRDADFDGDGRGELVHGDYFHRGPSNEFAAGAVWVYGSDAVNHATLPADRCAADAAIALDLDPPTAVGSATEISLGEATAFLPMASATGDFTEDFPRYAVSADVPNAASSRQIEVHTLYGAATVETSLDGAPQPTLRWLSYSGADTSLHWFDGKLEFEATDPEYGLVLAISTEMGSFDWDDGLFGPFPLSPAPNTGTLLYAWTGANHPTLADLVSPPFGMVEFTYFPPNTVSPSATPQERYVSLSAADHCGAYAGQQVFAQVIEFDLNAPATSARASDLVILRLAP
ncbi:MAG: VCBS repeat-containing protein [Planctomycetes bacterium]|nr:VCBS repeat-containing protein [Planctomycetota bacterium]